MERVSLQAVELLASLGSPARPAASLLALLCQMTVGGWPTEVLASTWQAAMAAELTDGALAYLGDLAAGGLAPGQGQRSGSREDQAQLAAELAAMLLDSPLGRPDRLAQVPTLPCFQRAV